MAIMIRYAARSPSTETLQADPGAPFVEQYGEIQPVPQHDGTECLKWDDSLWGHAEHFKVCMLPVTVSLAALVHTRSRIRRNKVPSN